MFANAFYTVNLHKTTEAQTRETRETAIYNRVITVLR